MIMAKPSSVSSEKGHPKSRFESLCGLAREKDGKTFAIPKQHKLFLSVSKDFGGNLGLS